MGKQYAAIALPLNRPEIVRFLLPPTPKPRGATLHIVGQRPSFRAETGWIERLRQMPAPSLADFLDIDDPRHNLEKTTTDRLVPVELLAQPGYLTRNLGGWSPIYFGVACLPSKRPSDPLLDQVEVLADYGWQVRYFGADKEQVTARLEAEAECDWPTLLCSLIHLHSLRPAKGKGLAETKAYIEKLFRETLSGNCLAGTGRPPMPKILLYDELLSQMRHVELARRRYLMAGKTWPTLTIQTWQETWRQELGVMIVKGEYIAGRHRGSLVLIAPQLGVVIKQPAPEPFHLIEPNAKTINGQPENWPVLTQDGALVTPRGRIRLLLEEGFIPRLHRIFNHRMTFSTLMGFTLEAFVAGHTVQAYVLADHERMTADLYDAFILHQQTCEALGVENGDWHAANFILPDRDGEIVHVDWGAARPLQPEELTPAGGRTRLNQVQNIAYSFHNEALAHRVRQLHADLVADTDRLDRIRQQARGLADAKPAN